MLLGLSSSASLLKGLFQLSRTIFVPCATSSSYPASPHRVSEAAARTLELPFHPLLLSSVLSASFHQRGTSWVNLCLEIVHTFKTVMCFTAATSLQQHLLQAVWGPREPSEVEENHLFSSKRCRIYWWWHFGLTGINSPVQILITCALCFSVSPSTKCVFTGMQRAPELLLFCWVSFSLVPFSFHALVYKFLISSLPE